MNLMLSLTLAQGGGNTSDPIGPIVTSGPSVDPVTAQEGVQVTRTQGVYTARGGGVVTVVREFRVNAAQVATGATYTPDNADVGLSFIYFEQATEAGGASPGVVTRSVSIGTVLPVAPTVTVTPSSDTISAGVTGTVATIGGAGGGSLALEGTDASTFTLAGTSLNLAAASVTGSYSVTIRRTNAAGEATGTFNLTVAGAGVTANAIFGIDTAEGDGGTQVSAPDGTYDSDNLTVTSNVLTKASGGTPSVGQVTVGDTTVDLVSGVSVASGAEFAAWLDTTASGGTLAYDNLVVSGDLVNRTAVSNWNNKWRNIPDDFRIVDAYPGGTASTIDYIRIQTSGTLGSAATINRLKFENVHFYEPIDISRGSGLGNVNFHNFEVGPTVLQGLEFANCEFSSDLTWPQNGGFFPPYLHNAIDLNNFISGLWMHGNSIHNVVYPIRGSTDGALFENNEIYDTLADFFTPEGGTSNWIMRWNDLRGVIGDGTFLHADVCQFQTQNGAEPVSGIYFYGNTSTPADYWDRAWPQADAPFPLPAVTVTGDADASVTTGVQGQRFDFSGITADRTLNLPDVASNDGLAFSVTNFSDTHNVNLSAAGSDTIADSGVITQGVTRYYSDGSTEWKRMPLGFAGKEVPVTANKTLTSLYSGMLIGASAGVNITLDSSGTQTVIRKHDNTAGTVTITAPAGQNIEGGASTTITASGGAKDFTRSGNDWSFAFDGVTMQGVFGNPHAEYNGTTQTDRQAIIDNSFSDFNVFCNVITQLSSAGIWLEQTVPGAFYAWNTWGRVIPSDFDGDGVVTQGDAWVSGTVGKIRSSTMMATMNNFTVGNLQLDVISGLTDADVNPAIQRDNVELALTDATTAAASLSAYFNGTTPSDYQPTTRAEVLDTWLLKSGTAMPAGVGALGTTTANGIADFDNQTINFPSPAYVRLFPQRNAAAIPLDAIMRVETNIPVEALGTETLELYNVTDAASVPATFYVQENYILCDPTSDLINGKEYRITYDGVGIVNRLQNLSVNIGNSSVDPVQITPGAADIVPAIAATDWTFTASSSAYQSVLDSTPEGFENLITTTPTLITAQTDFDSRVHITDDLPGTGYITIKFLIAESTGTAQIFVRGLDNNTTVNGESYTIQFNQATGAVSDYGGKAVGEVVTTFTSGVGTEVALRVDLSGASVQPRILLRFRTGGSNFTLSQVAVYPVDDTSAPFVRAIADWDDIASDPGLSAPVISGVPTISGTETVGQTLTATAASVTGNPTPTRTWQWVNSVSGDISGATSSTYTLQASDEGDTITVRQTETNSEGSDSATSAATGAIAAAGGSAPTLANLTTYQSASTISTTHTTGSFTPDGSRDVLIEVISRNDGSATGNATISAAILNGVSITGNIIAQQGTSIVTGGGRNCVVVYRVPAASVSAASQTFSTTYGGTQRDMSIVVSEVTGGGAIGATSNANGQSAGTSETLSITTTGSNSLVRYVFGHENPPGHVGWTGVDSTELEVASGSVHQSIAQEEVASAGSADATVTWTNSARHAGVAYEILS